MKVSKYLTLAEATRSARAEKLGIDNSPTPEHLENIRFTASNIFDKVREHIGGPLFASSFYRSAKLNQTTPGASKTSQHLTGQAVDIDCKRFGNGSNVKVFNFIKNQLEFDQLIWEFGTDSEPQWVHASIRSDGKNRKQILRAIKLNGKTKYIPYQ